MRPRRGGCLLRALSFALALVICAWLVGFACVVGWEHRDAARPAGAIVVLGAAQYAGRPSPVLRARLDHAVALWQKKLAPRLIVTGGRGEGDTTTEAEVSRRYVIRKGVPASAILVERNGRTTSESMEAVAAIMRTQLTRDVILVSDPYHMFRLQLLAQHLGLRPFTSPTPTSPIMKSPRAHWRYVFIESLKVPLTVLGATGN